MTETPPAGAAPVKPKRGAVKEAKRFSKEMRKLHDKNRGKVSEARAGKVLAALEALDASVAAKDDVAALEAALAELESTSDEVFGFAKKSAAREFFESIFVAVAIALVLRAFVVEAFKIPSGSMIPTLEVGDHIFVNKFIYGLRVPLTNSWFVQWGSPARGDVIVFRYPVDPSKDYIKRVVAVAGDRVRVIGRDVFVNGEQLEREGAAAFEYVEDAEPGAVAPDVGSVRRAFAFPEASAGTGEARYTVLYAADRKFREPFPSGDRLPGLQCQGAAPGNPGECEVQPGYVFVMGDNRDNSYDSRGWGGVPTDNVKGRAMFVWWSRGQADGVRLGRLGTPID